MVIFPTKYFSINVPKLKSLCLRVNCRFGIHLSIMYIWSVSLDFSFQRLNCISRISSCLSILIPRKATRQMFYGILTASQMMFGQILHIIWIILNDAYYTQYCMHYISIEHDMCTSVAGWFKTSCSGIPATTEGGLWGRNFELIINKIRKMIWKFILFFNFSDEQEFQVMKTL